MVSAIDRAEQPDTFLTGTRFAKPGGVFKLRVLSILIFTVLAVAAQAGQRTIVISDIDDTIRLTQVRPGDYGIRNRIRHSWNLVRGLFKSHNAFVGMPSLYMALATNGAEIHYVSGAPQFISRLPEKFLLTSGFPTGELSLRPSLRIPTEEYKVDRIGEIIAANPDARFILIGDNGEKDVAVFRRLKDDSRFSTKIAGVYVHRLYREGIGMPIESGQSVYLTAADLALQLVASGDIEARQAAETIKVVKEGLDSRFSPVSNRAFPRFALAYDDDVERLENLNRMVEDATLRNSFARVVDSIRPRAIARGLSCRAIFFAPAN